MASFAISKAMKRFIITFMSVLLAVIVLIAKEVTAEQARTIALQFVNAPAAGQMRARALAPQQIASAELRYHHLHGFNLAGGGFVVVSTLPSPYLSVMNSGVALDCLTSDDVMGEPWPSIFLAFWSYTLTMGS